MIIVEVLSINGRAPPSPTRITFGEAGGTLGRAPECTLPLPDETRAVSRLHGEFRFDQGQFFLSDQGTNPLKVNGQAVGKGRSVPVAVGDRIEVGPYQLKVCEGAAQSSSRDGVRTATPQPSPTVGNPFDDLLGGSREAGASSEISSGTQKGADEPPHLPDDEDDPFADLGAPAPKPAKPTPTPPAAARGGGVLLPDDFDFMAEPTRPSGVGAGESALPDEDLNPLSSAPLAPGEGSLDALFGLEKSNNAAQPLDKSLDLGGGGATGADSLEDWLQGPPGHNQGAPVRDDGAVLQTPFELTPSASARSAKSASETGGRTREPPAGRSVAEPGASIPQRTATSKAAATVPGGDVLLRALLEGLQAPEIDLRVVDADLMHRLGCLLRESTSGTLALLNARATVKQELRADVTMISGKQNNPLKFSPDVQGALRHFFGVPTPGFMTAEEAMRDAYDDLRAHEIGFMAGLRAALTGVLGRFDPERLEQRLPRKGGLDALLPVARRARLWELFTELYRDLSNEAEEDFHQLFGREFLKAYSEHVAAMRRTRPGSEAR